MVEGAGFEPAKLSRQIYSLIPLTTREPLRAGNCHAAALLTFWSWWRESNPRPTDYKSVALPAELHQLQSLISEGDMLRILALVCNSFAANNLEHGACPAFFLLEQLGQALILSNEGETIKMLLAPFKGKLL